MAKANQGRCTLRDVAAEVGMSLPTVSAILGKGTRNNSRYSLESYERVMAAARRLRYRPNRAMSNSSRGRHGAVGLLARNLHHIPEQALNAMHFAVRDHDQMLILEGVTGIQHPESADYVPCFIAEDAVDGIIVWGDLPESLTAELLRIDTPRVFVNSSSQQGDNCLLYDEEAGMRQVMEHLVARGRRHILYLAPQDLDGGHYSMRQRWDILVQLANELGMAAPECLLVAPPGVVEQAVCEQEENVTAMASALDRKAGCDAVLLCMDIYAPQVYLAARRARRSIPGNLSVIGYNNSVFAPLLDPPLTSVGVNGFHAGEAAVRILNQAIAGDGVAAEPVHQPMTLTIRQSS